MVNVHIRLEGDISVRSEIYTRSTEQANTNEARLPISYTFLEEHRQNQQFLSSQINKTAAIH